MVVEQYLGPLREPILSLAATLSTTLASIGVNPPPELYLCDALIFTLSLILLTTLSITVLHLLTKRDPRDSILLVGISGEGDAPAVGKTALFHALRHKQQPKFGTVPSMHVNTGVFPATATKTEGDANPQPQALTTPPIRWVDFPGHPRLRSRLAAYLAQARGVVFVIDGTRFFGQARRDAELLYDVLTHAVVSKRGTPVLVFINKRDVASSASSSHSGTMPTPAAVRSRLEAELERARTARAGSLRGAAVGDSGAAAGLGGDAQGPMAGGGDAGDYEEDEQTVLGLENEPFSFEHVAGPVTFGYGSALSCDVVDIVEFEASCRS